MEMMSSVESLAKTASILTDFASIGSADNQSAISSVDRSPGLMSSLIRILKRSLGYSGSSDTEVVDESKSLLDGLKLEAAPVSSVELLDSL